MSAETPDDRLQRAMAGDERALSDLLASCHDGLVRDIAGRVPVQLRGLVAPEDVAQEAYVVAFRRITTLQLVEGAEFGDWLSGVAVNVLRDAVRRQRATKRGGDAIRVEDPRGDEASMVALLEQLAAYSRTPSQSAARADMTVEVRQALAGLPAEQRAALELRYVEGLPIAEIAARMQRSDGAIHQLCHRGLRGMAEALGGSSRFFSRKE